MPLIIVTGSAELVAERGDLDVHRQFARRALVPYKISLRTQDFSSFLRELQRIATMGPQEEACFVDVGLWCKARVSLQYSVTAIPAKTHVTHGHQKCFPDQILPRAIGGLTVPVPWMFHFGGQQRSIRNPVTIVLPAGANPNTCPSDNPQSSP